MTTPRQLGRRSAGVLAFLDRMPRVVVLLCVVAVLLGGAFLPGVAGALLLAVAVALFAWLGWLSWPEASAGARLGRLAAIGVLVAYLVAKLV